MWIGLVLLLGLIHAGFCLPGKEQRQHQTYLVLVKPHSFEPDVVEIRAGDSVQWYIEDRGDHWHQIVSDNGLFQSDILRTRDVFTVVFNLPGKYPYHDGGAPLVKGEVRVLPSIHPTSETTPTSSGTDSGSQISSSDDHGTSSSSSSLSDSEAQGILLSVMDPHPPLQSLEEVVDGKNSGLKMGVIIGLSLMLFTGGVSFMYYLVTHKMLDDQGQTQPLKPLHGSYRTIPEVQV